MALELPRTQAMRSSDHGRIAAKGRWGIALAGAAAVLGGLALLARAQGRRAERRHPPAGRFVAVDGVRLHYVERGRGQSLVLLHGMGSMLQDFGTSVLDDLARDYRVIAFDRPGYGYSERPAHTLWTPARQARLLHRALLQLGIERPIVLGHSFGALVALAYGLDHPESTAALVLLGGYVFPIPRPGMALAGVFRVPLIGTVLRNTVAPFATRAVMPAMLRDVVFAPNPVPARFAAGFPIDLACRPRSLRAITEEAVLLRPAAAALSRRYGEVAVPVVILAGVSDRVVDAHRHSARLHRLVRHSAVRLLPRTGHMVHHAAPAAVRDAVEIARQEAGAAA